MEYASTPTGGVARALAVWDSFCAERWRIYANTPKVPWPRAERRRAMLKRERETGGVRTSAQRRALAHAAGAARRP